MPSSLQALTINLPLGVKAVDIFFFCDQRWKSLTNEEALKNAKYKKDGYFKAPRILKKG